MSKQSKSDNKQKPTATTKKPTSTTSKKPTSQAKTSSVTPDSKGTIKPLTTKTDVKKPATTAKTIVVKTNVKKSVPTEAKKAVKKVSEKTEEEGPLEFYLKAGAISIQVKEFLRNIVKVGASVLDICERGEAKIKELGGNWAFPLNVSINNIAAHYSSPPEDDLIIQKGDIVKIDSGVQINGYVADTAFTVSFNDEHKDLIKASLEATKAATDIIRPGILTNRLGEEIEEIIRSYDYRPIRELSGHQLDQNILHGPIIIPNVKGTKGIKLEEGQAFAIETFASTGTGKLTKGEIRCFIFQLNPLQIPIRLEPARKARKVILADYSNFPFTTRWIAKELTTSTAIIGLNYLANQNQIKRYPVLSDERDSFVSQSEETVYLTGKSRVVTTLPNQ